MKNYKGDEDKALEKNIMKIKKKQNVVRRDVSGSEE